VAEQRRALPPGGKVTKDYRSRVSAGLWGLPISLATSKRSWSTAICSGRSVSDRARCAPRSSARGMARRATLSNALHWRWSPAHRLSDLRLSRGTRLAQPQAPLRHDGRVQRDYHALSPEGADDAAFNVFTRRDGAIRHFWSGEMGFESADPGQDPRGAARPHADMDYSRFDAGGTRNRLVYETGGQL